MTTKAVKETAEPIAEEIDADVADGPEDQEHALAIERFLARSSAFQVPPNIERMTNPFRYEPIVDLAASVAAMAAKHDVFHTPSLAATAGAIKYDALASNLAAAAEVSKYDALSANLAGAARATKYDLGGLALATDHAGAARATKYDLGGLALATDLAAAARATKYDLFGMSTGLAAAVSRLHADDLFASVVGLGHTSATAALLAEAAAPHSLLSAGMDAFDTTKMFGLHNAVLGLAHSDRVPPWKVMGQMARAAAGVGVFAEEIQRMAVADRSLRKALPELSRDLWSTHWKLTGIPTLSFLGREWDMPVGLLQEMASPDLGASLSWLNERRAQPQISRAVLSPEAAEDSSTPIIVECDPSCCICGNPMRSLKETIRWIGPKLGIRTRHILPLCATCTSTEREDPGFILRSLPASGAAGLRVKPEVIRGSGQGDGKPRGRLRLLRSDD